MYQGGLLLTAERMLRIKSSVHRLQGGWTPYCNCIIGVGRHDLPTDSNWCSTYYGVWNIKYFCVVLKTSRCVCFLSLCFSFPVLHLKIKVKMELLSRVRLCNPMDCSMPSSSIHWIFQARILEWVATSFSTDLPDPGIEPGSPALQAGSLLSEPPGKPGDPVDVGNLIPGSSAF